MGQIQWQLSITAFLLLQEEILISCAPSVRHGQPGKGACIKSVSLAAHAWVLTDRM